MLFGENTAGSRIGKAQLSVHNLGQRHRVPGDGILGSDGKELGSKLSIVRWAAVIGDWPLRLYAPHFCG